jgi:hypothetical protein
MELPVPTEVSIYFYVQSINRVVVVKRMHLRHAADLLASKLRPIIIKEGRIHAMQYAEYFEISTETRIGLAIELHSPS